MTDSSTSSNKIPSGRQTRSDKGHPQLTHRDETILRLIGEQIAYRFDQLQRLLACHAESHSQDPAVLSESRTYALIQRWQKLDLADYCKIRHYEPGWIYLTRKGLSYLRLPVRFLDPYHSDLDHLFWINETRVQVEESYGSYPEFQWESERLYRATRERFKAQRRQEPGCWIPLEYRSAHRPDALLRYQIGEEPATMQIVTSIETEFSEKANATWHAIFIDLLQHAHYAYYYVHPDIKSTFVKALTQFQTKEPAFGEPNRERRQCISVHDLNMAL
jgi:hypothetical protein